MGYNCFIVRWNPLNADKTEDKNTPKTSGDDEKGRFDHDGFWKDLLDKFCYSLFKRALPHLYEDADLSVKPTLLNKEFTDILNTGDHKIRTAPHFVDSVLSVPLKNGESEPVIIHVEAQQGHGGGDMAERMNFYRCPIYFHFRREPVALAIIAGRRPKGEARYYSHDHYGTKIMYEYNNLVLSELDDEELVSSGNPIDIVLYAAKFAQRARKEHQKLNFLHKAVELLDERGWSMEDKHDLLLFTERIVNLRDEELITRYREDMEHRNREGKSMYIPLMLRDSAAEIEQRGAEKAKLEVARNLLAKGIAPDIVTETTGLPEKQIKKLLN
jgi:predicted transposase/invertase (TIGR01784 family)